MYSLYIFLGGGEGAQALSVLKKCENVLPKITTSEFQQVIVTHLIHWKEFHGLYKAYNVKSGLNYNRDR